jgi:ribosomal protein L13
MKKTYQPKAKEIQRRWHLIDAKDEVFGPVGHQNCRLINR